MFACYFNFRKMGVTARIWYALAIAKKNKKNNEYQKMF